MKKLILALLIGAFVMGSTFAKTAVVYFSQTGTTERMARLIQNATGADIFRIEPKEPYTRNGSAMGDIDKIAKEEIEKNILPPLKATVPNLAQYDTVFVGCPVWRSTTPRIIDSFIAKHDFSGKTVIPFATYYSSGIDETLRHIESLTPASAHKKGLGLTARTLTQTAVENWIREIMNEKTQKTVTLNSGYEMPTLGLGTWTLTGATAENAVYAALKAGYRLIDTAKYYGNETEVGNALRRAVADGICTREEVFVTTKLVPWSNTPDADIDDSLKRLGVSYIDLVLLHQHGTNDDEVYRAMCRAVTAGKIRSIGISNFYTQKAVSHFIAGFDIPPAVVQNENHLLYQNNALRDWAAKQNIFIESYYPFGGRGHTKDHLQNKTVLEIAKAHRKTSAQIIVRWHLQAGYIAVPGSSSPAHIAENFAVWDFSLTESEMRRLSALDTGKRYENW